MQRFIFVILIIVCIIFCAKFFSKRTVALCPANLTAKFQQDTPKIKLKPVTIYGVSQKDIKAFDSIHLTVEQAKNLIYSLKSDAVEQYLHVKHITDSAMNTMTTFHKTLYNKQLKYLKNIIQKSSNHCAYILNDFITYALGLLDSIIPKYPDFWKTLSKEEKKYEQTHTGIQFFPLLGDSASLNLFALGIGCSGAWENYVLFFKRNKLIGYKKIFHHYGLPESELKATIIDRDTILCFNEIFDSGTGIWWHENFFYLIKNDTIIPIQSIIKDGNWAIVPAVNHVRFMQLNMLNCNPLKFKAKYKFTIFITLSHSPSLYRNIFKDSTIIAYKWDKHRKKFTPLDSKLDSLQLYSFVPDASPALLTYAFRKVLIRYLHKKEYQKWILWFLQVNFEQQN